MSHKGKDVAESSTYKMKALCILAGSELGRDASFPIAAKELGKEMASRNINVVYGGGMLGLGAHVASSALSGGSKIIAVTLINNASSSTNNRPIFSFGREWKVLDSYQRMVYMLKTSDAFVVMPGGLDNLELFSTIMLWAKCNVHKRPIGFFNINGFFDGLLAFLVRAGEQGFIPRDLHHLIVAASTPGQLIDLLQGLVQAPIPPLNQVVQYPGDKRKRDEPDLDLRL